PSAATRRLTTTAPAPVSRRSATPRAGWRNNSAEDRINGCSGLSLRSPVWVEDNLIRIILERSRRMLAVVLHAATFLHCGDADDCSGRPPACDGHHDRVPVQGSSRGWAGRYGVGAQSRNRATFKASLATSSS